MFPVLGAAAVLFYGLLTVGYYIWLSLGHDRERRSYSRPFFLAEQPVHQASISSGVGDRCALQAVEAGAAGSGYRAGSAVRERAGDVLPAGSSL